MFKVRAVLSDCVYSDISLVNVFAVEVLDKKRISTLLKHFRDLFPIPELDHLKRVKSSGNAVHVLVCPTKSDTIKTFFSERLQAHVDLAGLGELSIVPVCRNKPITRTQFEAAAKYWPTNFHENKRLEKSLRGELFSDEELARIKMFMDTAGSMKRPVVDGAIVVDPLTSTIVAQGTLNPTHPLKHAVMVAINNVAVGQAGGAWNHGKASLLQENMTGTKPAATESDSEDLETPIVKRSKKSAQYLCTGYDLYTLQEPCVMCSMALVHSRIGRVFYSRENNKDGGLGSIYKIHLQEGLNHHFEVFTCVQHTVR